MDLQGQVEMGTYQIIAVVLKLVNDYKRQLANSNDKATDWATAESYVRSSTPGRVTTVPSFRESRLPPQCGNHLITETNLLLSCFIVVTVSK